MLSPTMQETTRTSDPSRLPVKGRHMLGRWRAALKDMGGDRSFYSQGIVERRVLNLGELSYPQLFLSNPVRNNRSESMRQKTVKELPVGHDLGYRLDCNCPLCREVGRGHLDANRNGLPIVTKLSDGILVIPNLYPSYKGHALVLNREHDDLQDRVIPTTEGNEIYIPPAAGKTRGRLLVVPEVKETFLHCTRNGYLANRNNPLDGMSLLLHDHWHAHRLVKKIVDFLYDLDSRLVMPCREKSYRIKNTPSDKLVIRGEDSLSALAAKAVQIYNTLELQNIVAVMMFSPMQGGSVIFSILDPAAGPQDYRAARGGGVFLNLLTKQECHGGIKNPPPRNTVDWQRLTHGAVTLST